MAMVSALSLDGWGNIAQFRDRHCRAMALGFAAVEVRISRANTRRARVYDYADRFNQPEILRAGAHYRDYWGKPFLRRFRCPRPRGAPRIADAPEPDRGGSVPLQQASARPERRSRVVGNLCRATMAGEYPTCERPPAGRRQANDLLRWEEMQHDTPGRKMKAIPQGGKASRTPQAVARCLSGFTRGSRRAAIAARNNADPDRCALCRQAYSSR